MGARRTAGEGSITPYTTAKGDTLWSIRYLVTDATGATKRVHRRGFATKKLAAAALVDVRGEIKRGTHRTEKSPTLEAFLGEWLDGLRLKDSTRAYYRKNVRLHVVPYLGSIRLSDLTGQRLSAHYRTLEASGRKGRGVKDSAGLSGRTVRGIHDIIHSAMREAVRDGLLPSNPADRAQPPTAAQTKGPEIHPWSAPHIQAFLQWSADTGDELLPAWQVLLTTGVRRGELLGLRWSDFDRTSGTLSVRRSVTSIRVKGEPERINVGTTKGGAARRIELDDRTIRVLSSHRSARGAISLSLAGADSYIFGDLDGRPHHPDRFSRKFQIRAEACRASQRRAAGASCDEARDVLPQTRLHDLRHASATLAFERGVNAKVIQERLGHSTIAITLSIYSHVTPTMQRDVADVLGAAVYDEAPAN